MSFKIFINFKTYPQGTGEKAVELARICGEVGKVSNVSKVSKGDEGIEIIPVVQAVDVFRIKQEVDIPVWIQHLDFQKQGQYTGWQNLEAAIEAGARGTLLNHSEHQIPPGTIKHIVDRVGKFQIIICCKTLGQMERLIKLKPDYIGYEIEHLIGSKTSITEANPKEIVHAAGICGKIPLVVGAGVHNGNDLKKAKELGSQGVLISSAVVLAENPKERLEEMISKL